MNKTEQINFRVTPQLRDSVDSACGQVGVNRSTWMQQAIAMKLEQSEESPLFKRVLALEKQVDALRNVIQQKGA